jgi:hypothetical protein
MGIMFRQSGANGAFRVGFAGIDGQKSCLGLTSR